MNHRLICRLNKRFFYIAICKENDMLTVDLHSHTLFSMCGNHTVIEMLEAAKKKGVKALAITDHGKTLGGRIGITFFKRVIDPVDGIKLLKGMECNLISEDGEIDFMAPLYPYMDIILAAIHPNMPQGRTRKEYTAMTLAMIEKNPFIDIITHPDCPSPTFFHEYDKIADAARDAGMALELNNSKSRPALAVEEETMALITACKETDCPVAINSDAHAVNEIGDDSFIRPLLARAGFPEKLIVNRTLETAMEFIEQRKLFRNAFFADANSDNE